MFFGGLKFHPWEGRFGVSRAKLRLIVLAAAAFVSACATRPGGLLEPVAPVAQATSISVLTISTRAPSSRPGFVYSGERGDQTTLAAVEVSIPPGHRIGRIETPRGGSPDPTEHFAASEIRTLDEPGADQWIETHATDGRVLIYVHGYNIPFDYAVFRVAQIAVDSGLTAAPVLFTWPSRGHTFAYLYDRESTNFSRDALERTLRIACRNPQVRELNVLAHSMGAWLTIEALRQYAIRDGAVCPKIQNVVLASPDLDIDVFLRQFEALGPDRPYFTFLISQRDFALRISRILSGGIQRLGATNPEAEPFKSKLESTGGVALIDLSSFARQGTLNHSKYASTPEVTKRLGELFFQSRGRELPDAYPSAPPQSQSETQASPPPK